MLLTKLVVFTLFVYIFGVIMGYVYCKQDMELEMKNKTEL